MFTWWDSLEAVTRFNTAVQWLAAILAILAGIFGVLILVSGSRVSELQNKQAEAKEVEFKSRLETAETKQQPRSFTAEQQELFIKTLASAPKGVIDIEAPSDDAEAGSFANQIVKVLEAAGWKINGFARSQFPDGANPKGISIGIMAEEQRPQADALTKAFESVGMPVKSSFSQNSPAPPLVIVIGSKPEHQ